MGDPCDHKVCLFLQGMEMSRIFHSCPSAICMAQPVMAGVWLFTSFFLLASGGAQEGLDSPDQLVFRRRLVSLGGKRSSKKKKNPKILNPRTPKPKNPKPYKAGLASPSPARRPCRGRRRSVGRAGVPDFFFFFFSCTRV